MPIGVRATSLPLAERGGQETRGSAIGLRYDGGEPAVGEERVHRAANSGRVVVVGLVREGSPLRGLVDGVSLQYQPAFRAYGVSGGVVEHNLRELVAVAAEQVCHIFCVRFLVFCGSAFIVFKKSEEYEFVRIFSLWRSLYLKVTSRGKIVFLQYIFLYLFYCFVAQCQRCFFFFFWGYELMIGHVHLT